MQSPLLAVAAAATVILTHAAAALLVPAPEVAQAKHAAVELTSSAAQSLPPENTSSTNNIPNQAPSLQLHLQLHGQSQSQSQLQSQSQSSSSQTNHTNPSGNSYSTSVLRHSISTTVILTIAYAIVFVVGISGNSFVVAIVCKSPRMRTVTNYFIANLAFADILVLLCLPATLVNNIFIPYYLGLYVCKTVSYLQGVSVSASINTMLAVTLDRFLAIWFPMDWHLTRRAARWTIAAIWLFSFTISLPWFAFFTLAPYQMESVPEAFYVCEEDWPTPRLGVIYFVCANLILCYLLPLVVITVCYLGIWYKIWRRNIPGAQVKGLQIELLMQKSKLKVVKMMFVVVVIFVISWAPLYAIFARLKLGPAKLSNWEDWLVSTFMPLAQWLGASNSCINPILYTFFNSKYKRGFAEFIRASLCCRCSRHRPDSASTRAFCAGQKTCNNNHTNRTTLDNNNCSIHRLSGNGTGTTLEFGDSHFRLRPLRRPRSVKCAAPTSRTKHLYGLGLSNCEPTTISTEGESALTRPAAVAGKSILKKSHAAAIQCEPDWVVSVDSANGIAESAPDLAADAVTDDVAKDAELKPASPKHAHSHRHQNHKHSHCRNNHCHHSHHHHRHHHHHTHKNAAVHTKSQPSSCSKRLNECKLRNSCEFDTGDQLSTKTALSLAVSTNSNDVSSDSSSVFNGAGLKLKSNKRSRSRATTLTTTLASKVANDVVEIKQQRTESEPCVLPSAKQSPRKLKADSNTASASKPTSAANNKMCCKCRNRANHKYNNRRHTNNKHMESGDNLLFGDSPLAAGSEPENSTQKAAGELKSSGQNIATVIKRLGSSTATVAADATTTITSGVVSNGSTATATHKSQQPRR